jgi:phosphatidylglycerophosphate synthase
MTDGERWAAAELDSLRAARFRPLAWSRFLGASFRRATETRKARPELARQARTWSATGLIAGIAVCASPRLPAPRTSRFALWWLAASAMLDWHLGMVEGPEGEQRDRLTSADALTLLRIWSVPFTAAATRDERGFAALIAAAGATDALDGVLARRAGITRLGRDLDTIADAVTSAAAARAARRVATARSAVPVAVVAAAFFRTGQRPATDAFGATRRLAPIFLSGLAAAPFTPRTGAALTNVASIGSLVLAWHTRSTT